MVNPASITDLEARWRLLTGDEASNGEALLADAWAMLTHRLPTLEAALEDETISRQLVIAVECSMVLRVLRNPDGKRSESIDDYAWTRDGAVSAGALYVSDEELSWLSPISGATGAWSVMPYSDPVLVQPNWWVTTTDYL